MARNCKQKYLRLFLVACWGCVCLQSLHAEEPNELADQLKFSLDDLNGVPHEIQAKPGIKVVAIVFLSTECPIARSYLTKLNELHASWSKDASPVKLFGVISDPFVTGQEAKTFADEFKVRFPILYDQKGRLAQNLTPSHVPEAFVFDAKSHLAYRGRIDDTYAEVGRRRPAATQNDLEDAVAAVIKGVPVKSSRTTPVGCPLEAWKSRANAKIGK